MIKATYLNQRSKLKNLESGQNHIASKKTKKRHLDGMYSMKIVCTERIKRERKKLRKT